MTTLLKEMRIAQLSSQSKRILPNYVKDEFKSLFANFYLSQINKFSDISLPCDLCYMVYMSHNSSIVLNLLYFALVQFCHHCKTLCCKSKILCYLKKLLLLQGWVEGHQVVSRAQLVVRWSLVTPMIKNLTRLSRQLSFQYVA